MSRWDGPSWRGNWPNCRKNLGPPWTWPTAILLVDLSVTLAAVLTDEDDERPWQDRLTAFVEEFSLPPGGDDGIEQLGAAIASVDTDRIPLWINELGT